MPRKACCCDVKDGSVWVAVPCRYYGKIVFSGYSKGYTGFNEINKTQLQTIFESQHGIFGLSGPYHGLHPFYKFPDTVFPAVLVEGGPPIKITGTGPCDPTTGSIGWGGWGGQDCYQYIFDVDQERQVLYKLWGAGGGGVSETIYGGNGAYTQTQRNYSINDYASVGFGGFGHQNVQTRGSCYGTQGTDYTNITNSDNFIATIPQVLKTTGLGGQGYNSWGGGAAYISRGAITILESFVIAAGAGGAGDRLTHGGHGGITHGVDAPGLYGGHGATNAMPGTKGSSSASDAIGSMGGRGAPVLNNTVPPNQGISGGGGGGGGWGGGGGGGTGHGGGGGSSKTTLDGGGNTYSYSGSDYGPPNICDPDYFITRPDGAYSIPGLGGGFVVQATNQWAPDPIKSLYSLGNNGQSGKIVATYAAMHCPCDDTLDTIPDRSYICLSATQAKFICDNTTNCCEGTVGSEDTVEGNSGWSGNSGFTGTVCGYGSLFGDTGPSRTTGSCAGRGETGTASSFGPGGGCGGFGLGSIYCPDISGFTGLSGSDSGLQYPNQTRTGELNTIVYKSFKYDGELYYLLGPCGVACHPEYMIPEDAELTDIDCREWAACCPVVVAYPLCKATDPTDINCWSTNPCPCTPAENIEPFIVCENIENYPDNLFWTRVGDWYYSAAKTTYWQVFGEPEIKKLAAIPIILEDPCPPCTGGGFGSGDCTGGDQGGLGNNNGDPTQYNCCVDISEEQSILPSPHAVNITASFSYQGKGPYTIDSCVIPDGDCTCKKWDYTDTPFSDSLDSNLTTIMPCSFDDIRDYGYRQIDRSIEAGQCDPNTGIFGCPSGQPPIPSYQNLTYRIRYVGNYGSLLEEKCYSPKIRTCPPDPFYIKNGLPSEADDPDGLIGRGDPAFQIITTCQYDTSVCLEYNTCGAFPEIIESGYMSCQYNNCDGYNYPKESGKTVVTNGCRLSRLISKLQEISAQSQKFTVVDLGSPLDYWVGGPRSRFASIPGDELWSVDDFNITQNDTIVTITCTRTYYCRSPAFSIELIFGAKSIDKCCSAHPYMRFIQSSCGNYDATGWELPYTDFYGSTTCVATPANFIQCIEGRPSPVPTYKTLAQYENDPTITMVPDRAWTCLGGINGGSVESGICPDRYDDFDLPASCTIVSL